MPRIVLGAPVADRAWALPRWLDQIEQQTVQPDALVFVHTDTGDGTREILRAAQDRWPVEIVDAPGPVVHRRDRNRDRVGAYSMLADLRNRLLDHALGLNADVIVSLDTDIFLTESTAIEQLVDRLDKAPLSTPLVYLHEQGVTAGTYNAGYWVDAGSGPERRWRRPSVAEFLNAAGRPRQVDVPMACVAMRRDVALTCRYRYHEAGEDLGFGLDLDRNGLWADWLTGLHCPHVMDPQKLDAMVPPACRNGDALAPASERT